jgi:hypothetical protein
MCPVPRVVAQSLRQGHYVGDAAANEGTCPTAPSDDLNAATPRTLTPSCVAGAPLATARDRALSLLAGDADNLPAGIRYDGWAPPTL